MLFLIFFIFSQNLEQIDILKSKLKEINLCKSNEKLEKIYEDVNPIACHFLNIFLNEDTKNKFLHKIMVVITETINLNVNYEDSYKNIKKHIEILLILDKLSKIISFK